jgi:hypothetical protein
MAEFVPIEADPPADHVDKQDENVPLDALSAAELLGPFLPLLRATGDFTELRGRLERTRSRAEGNSRSEANDGS